MKMPVWYWSGVLTNTERVFDTTQRESIAIVWAVLLLRPYLEGTRFTIRADHDSLNRILKLSDASGRLSRLRLRLPKLDFGDVRGAGAELQATDKFLRLRSDGEEKTHLNDNLSVYNVKNMQVTNDETPYVSFCKEGDVESDLITRKPNENRPKYREMRVSTVQPTERYTKNCEVPTIEELTVNQTKYCRKAKKQVGMSELKIHVDHNAVLV